MSETSLNQPLRLLVIDDHNLFRSGVIALLSRQPGLEIVGEAADGLTGVQRARELQPDVILLDLNMPGMSGHETLKLLRHEAPAANVLMLTVSEAAEDLVDALRAGARGYLLKNIDVDYFVDAIQRAARGEAVVAPQMTGKLVAGLQQPVQRESEPGADSRGRLSAREREILVYLARGQSNKEIARELDLAESTVKIHVQNILRKLNLSSRVQAAVYAVESGIAPHSRDGGA